MQVFISTRIPESIRDYGLGISTSKLSILIPNLIICSQLGYMTTEIIETEFEKQIILEVAKNWKRFKHKNTIVIDLMEINSTPDPMVAGLHVQLLYKIIGIFTRNPYLISKMSSIDSILFNINTDRLSNNLTHKIGKSKQFQDQLLLNEIQEFMEE